jgi:hypothetical protein
MLTEEEKMRQNFYDQCVYKYGQLKAAKALAARDLIFSRSGKTSKKAKK